MLSVTIYFQGATLVPKDPHIFTSDDTSRTHGRGRITPGWNDGADSPERGDSSMGGEKGKSLKE